MGVTGFYARHFPVYWLWRLSCLRRCFIITNSEQLPICNDGMLAEVNCPHMSFVIWGLNPWPQDRPRCATECSEPWNTSIYYFETRSPPKGGARRNATPLNSKKLPIFFTREIWRRLRHLIPLDAKRLKRSRTSGEVGKAWTTQQFLGALVFAKIAVRAKSVEPSNWCRAAPLTFDLRPRRRQLL